MITGIAAWLVTKGVGEKFARPLVIGGMVVAALVALTVLKSCYDHSVVENANNKANAEFREKQLEVERELGAEKDARDAADEAGVAAEQEKVDEAEADGRTAADDVWGSMWD